MQDMPLAERIRPKQLVDMIGQEHLLAKGQIIHEIIKSKQPTSLILWGPPGSGKTTLARIIARETEAEFVELSAVTAGKADVVKVIKKAKANKKTWESYQDGSRIGDMQENGAQQILTPSIESEVMDVSESARKQNAPPRFTLLFVDEIHRFNKAQQDAFLPHVENGTIIFIGATTENPSFEVINPLLSRSRVVVLEPLSNDEIIKIIKKAAKFEKIDTTRLPSKSIDLLAELSGGDARIALSNLEIAARLTKKVITPKVVETAAQRRIPGHDKAGETHYNVISAFIKSLRGGDANAALYYMSRMLQAGEDPKFIARRMVIFASEDIGVAASAALNIAVSTFQAVERLGMPECQYNLFHCTVVLAKCQKSRVVTDAMSKALAAAKEYPDLPVPLHLRNAPTKLMKDLGYQRGYKWQADFKHEKGFMPDELRDGSVN